MLTLAVLLVLGVGRLMSWGSDGKGGDDDDKAVQSASGASVDPGDGKPTTKRHKAKGDKGDSGRGKGKGQRTPTPTPSPTPTPLATPSGPCPDSDVLVTPSVPAPVAGSDVTIVLNLQTGTTEACTWHVSSDTVTLTIGDGPDDIWSSLECPGAIPSTDVVVRRTQATAVPVIWSSKRSDDYCTNRTAWVLPGTYEVAAAAFGGEPTEVTFELTAPTPQVVTSTPGAG